MRIALAFGTAAVAAAIGVFACSGSSSNGTPTDNGTSGDDGSSGSAGTSGQSSGGTSGATSGGTSGTSGGTSGTSGDSGPTSSSSGGTPQPVVDAGSLVDASTDAGPSECRTNSIAETEPTNDTQITPDTLPGAGGSICGSVSPPGDNDWITFTLPEGATGISLYVGLSNVSAAKIEATADGTAFTLSSPPFKPGKVYLIHISSMTAGTNFNWEFEMAPH